MRTLVIGLLALAACGTPTRTTPRVTSESCADAKAPTTVADWRALLARCPDAPTVEKLQAALVEVATDPQQVSALGGGDASTLAARAATAGDPKLAIALLAAATIIGGDPDALVEMGRALEVARDVDRAERAYAQAVGRARARNPGAAIVPRMPRPHATPIHSYACSRAGLVTASHDAIKRWDITSGIDVDSVPFNMPVTSIAVPAAGDVVYASISGGAGTGVLAVDLAGAKARWTLDTKWRVIGPPGVLVDGDKALLLADRKALRRVDTANGNVTSTIETTVDEPTHVVSDGKHAVLGAAQQLVVIDLGTKQTSTAPTGELKRLAMSRDGKRIATWDVTGAVEVRSIPTLAKEWSGTAPGKYEIGQIAFGLDDKTVIAIDKTGKRSVWPIGGGEPTRSAITLEGGLAGATVCDDGKLAGSTKYPAAAGLFLTAPDDLANARMIYDRPPIAAVSFGTTPNRLVTGHPVVVWTELGDPRALQGGMETYGRGVAWLSNHEVAEAGLGELRVWNVETGARRKLDGGHYVATSTDRSVILTGGSNVMHTTANGTTTKIPVKGFGLHATLSADGKHVAYIEHPQTTIYAIDGTAVRTFEDSETSTVGLAWIDLIRFDETSRQAVLYGRKNLGGVHEVVRIDIASGAVVSRFALAAQGTEMTTWSGHVVVGFHGGALGIWDGAGKLLATLEGHSSAITGMSIHGDRLATSSHDGTVRLWSLRDRKALATLIAASTWSPVNKAWDVHWLVLGADGRVDGAPQMRSRIAWQIGKDVLPGEAAWRTQKAPGLWSELAR